MVRGVGFERAYPYKWTKLTEGFLDLNIQLPFMVGKDVSGSGWCGRSRQGIYGNHPPADVPNIPKYFVT